MNTFTPRIGYAQISTANVQALEAAGCTMIRTETGSGTALDGRPELRTILDFIHPGETLVITRIDRLPRFMRDLQTIVTMLKDKRAHLAATEQPVDTSTAAGKACLGHARRLRRVRDELAPRAPSGGHRRREAPRCLSRPTPQD